MTPKDYTSTLSLLNSTTGSTAGKKKNLAAQMREKAAAAAALKKENIHSNKSHLAMNSSGKRILPVSNFDSNSDPLGGTIKQGFMKKAKISSPLDTYEISDREDSDTDDDSDVENERQKKKVRIKRSGGSRHLSP